MSSPQEPGVIGTRREIEQGCDGWHADLPAPLPITACALRLTRRVAAAVRRCQAACTL